MFDVLLYVVWQTVTVIPMSLAVVFVLYEMQEEALGFDSAAEMPSSEDITKEQRLAALQPPEKNPSPEPACYAAAISKLPPPFCC